MKAVLSAGAVSKMESVYSTIADFTLLYQRPVATKRLKRKRKRPGCKLLQVPADYFFGEFQRSGR